MIPSFETLEMFSVTSEVSDATISVRLRRQTNYQPSRFTSGPYWLDLSVGSVRVPHYCVDERFAKAAAQRFLLQYVKGIAPTIH